MKMRIAMLALCAGMIAIVQADAALAAANPIPGVDVIVKRHPPKVIKTGAQNRGKQSISDQASAGSLTSYKSKKKTTTGNGKPETLVNTSRSNIKHSSPPPR